VAKDDRIFKVTKASGKVQYCNRIAVSGMFAHCKGSHDHTAIRVEATNADATEGWTDVTLEFARRTIVTGCRRHRSYTGTRKPGYRWYSDKLCTCWKIYGKLHPDYPKHSGWCDKPASDPQHCDCKMLVKILG
jgi:hypothetical protein